MNDGFTEMAMGARELLESVVQYLDPDARVEVESEEETIIHLTIRGDGSGILIGHRGATLESLQYLLNLMVHGQPWYRRASLVIDAEGYRARRREQLVQLAQETANDVRSRRRPLTLENLTPAERRIIHMTLRDETDVVTSSHGEGRDRVLTVAPADDGE